MICKTTFYMNYKKNLFISIVSILSILMLNACSEDNPVNILPSDVAGDYFFTEFQFVPDASAIAPANVLDTLVFEDTYLRLIAGGQFIINYRFIDGPESIISGDFSVTIEKITLRAAPGSEARLISLLLNSPLEFDRNTVNNGQERLIANIRKTVDLESYSDSYDGVPPVKGTLKIQLDPIP